MLAKTTISCRTHETPDRAQNSKHFLGIGDHTFGAVARAPIRTTRNCRQVKSKIEPFLTEMGLEPRGRQM